MSRNLQSQTKLTEFAPLSPEAEDRSGFGYLFSKFFTRSQTVEENDKVVSPSESAAARGDGRWQKKDLTETGMEDKKDIPREFEVDVSEGRSLANVLKRISNLLALKNTGRRSYNDTELKQYWMPDSVSKECYECGERFTAFRRRHHCRVCGQIFCARCCNQEIPGKIINCTGDLRVCMYCGKVVLSYVESGDIGGIYDDLRALLLSKFGEGPQSPTQSFAPSAAPLDDPSKRKPSLGYQEERFALARSEGRVWLRGLIEEAVGSGGVAVATHRLRLRSHHASFQGGQLIDWLVSSNKAPNRSQGVSLGQAMLESGYIEGVEGGSEFLDGGALYRITQVDTVDEEAKHDSSADSESEFVTSEANLPTSNSIFNLNLNLEEKTAHISKPSAPPDAETNTNAKKSSSDAASESGIKALMDAIAECETFHLKTVIWSEVGAESLSGGHVQERSLYALRAAFEQHCSNLLRQLLNSEGLSQSWAEVIAPLARRAVDMSRPDAIRYDEMDIRQYVQFKKVAGGERSESEIIRGVVCSKNVVHRKMPSSITNPKILLLSCAIVYQRVEGKFLSLEPVIMQEGDYIGHAVARISALGPDLVLVGRGASRLAQESLLSLGISLALNVKPSALERIARLTGADILTSVDARLGQPKLGTSRVFYLRSFVTDTGRSKTLMVLEGRSEGDVGCTVVLRGGSLSELARVKRVAQMLTFAKYNARLELSYLMDSFASPPLALPPEPFFHDELHNSTALSLGSEIRTENGGEEEKGGDLRRRRIEKKERTWSVSDFSDPLHLYLSLDEEEPPQEQSELLSVAELPLCNKFRKALEDNILSVSPYLKFNVPYLESEAGRHCNLRPYLGQKIYWSAQFNEESTKTRTTSIDQQSTENFTLDKMKLLEEHELVRRHLTEPAESVEVRRLVAEYRACGGRLPLRTGLRVPLQRSTKAHVPPPPASMDVLHPPNHQRLSVLFCSYSPHSNNAPGFCVDPWVVEMELYGKNDIPLGMFLERYCWREEYSCPAEGGCSAPMLLHTRRFVHEGGALSVNTKRLESPIAPDNTTILWNWCPNCKIVSGMVGMSPETWSLSFAKYLELKFHGDVYTTQQQLPPLCPHSLHHQHVQYFANNNNVVSFVYNKISVWEISLPPLVLQTERESMSVVAMLEDTKTWSLLGQQVFSGVLAQLCAFQTTDNLIANLKQQLQKDQAHFKSRVEEIQAKLSLYKENEDKNNIVHWSWSIDDSMVLLKRLVAEGVEEWNQRLSEVDATLCSQRKKDEKRKSASDLKPSIADGLTEIPGEPIEACSETLIAEEIDSDQMRQMDTDTEAEDCDSPQVTNTDVKVPDKKSVKTILSQLLPAAPQNVYIQSPTNQTEHHCLPLCFPVPVVVYEREPSSIIAYALSSHEYRNALDQLKSLHHPSPSPLIKRKSGSDVISKESAGETTPPLDPRKPKVFSFLRTGDGPTSTTATSDGGTDEEHKYEDVKGKQKQHQSPNIEVQFADSSASFKVKIYFGEDFRKLRALVIPEGEEGFVRSLSRCVSWAATGGKSGSNFSKTKDDRFILKEMSRLETQIFIDFAPQYFNYMGACVRGAWPTLLGKIVGVFRVSYRNAGASYRSNLLVMEHLFHARPVTDKFDLKGSVRNRLVDTSLHPETVLLDENLINMTCDSPLYILPHSKTILMRAIHNDTQFLATQSVMDYSLLVGLDHTNRELVVGIIDYIRTFTWDKKLETMVKRYGLLGQGKQPTIISPDEYRDRFITAMHRYFLPLPDRWTGLGKGIDP